MLTKVLLGLVFMNSADKKAKEWTSATLSLSFSIVMFLLIIYYMIASPVNSVIPLPLIIIVTFMVLYFNFLASGIEALCRMFSHSRTKTDMLRALAVIITLVSILVEIGVLFLFSA
jgi:hypothetical protein